MPYDETKDTELICLVIAFIVFIIFLAVSIHSYAINSINSIVGEPIYNDFWAFLIILRRFESIE